MDYGVLLYQIFKDVDALVDFAKHLVDNMTDR